VTVTLTREEFIRAFDVGTRRRAEAIWRGYQERYGLDREKVALATYYNQVGAAGELAVAKVVNQHWHANTEYQRGLADVGEIVEVRTLADPDYDLSVRKPDPDDHAFVLVTGEPPTLTIHGWILGADAKKREDRFFSRGGRDKIFWIEQRDLRPIEELIEYEARRVLSKRHEQPPCQGRRRP
jgi:hypothetical protein